MSLLENFSQFILKLAIEYIFTLLEISFFNSFSSELFTIGLLLFLFILLINVSFFQSNQNEILFDKTSFLIFSFRKAPPPRDITLFFNLSILIEVFSSIFLKELSPSLLKISAILTLPLLQLFYQYHKNLN